MGVTIGIGAQKLIADMINGFFIIFENQFNVGDDVSINDLTGVVVNIGLKTTTLRSFDGKMYIISNSEINMITNHSVYPPLAIVEVYLSFDNDLEMVEEVMKEFAKRKIKLDSVIGDVNYTGINSQNEFGTGYRFTVLTKPFAHFGVERYLRFELLKEFQKKHLVGPKFFIDQKNEKSEKK